MNNLTQFITNKILICAEIGINHNGDLKKAEEMIAAAHECGANAVKFQAFKADHLFSAKIPGFSHTEKNVLAQLRNYEIQDAWWPQLQACAAKHQLLFSCSIFDSPSLTALSEVPLDFIKVASGEITNIPFIRRQTKLNQHIVVSTGAALLDEISRLVRALQEQGISELILLECTSSYPAAADNVFLYNIDFLRNTFQLPAGFSDHTLGIHFAIGAAARGACFIEKHFTLDKNLPGPDQALSADPAEFTAMVRAIRSLESGLKTNHKSFISACEQDTLKLGRKSVVAAKDIKKGNVIQAKDLTVKRPGLGIPPELMPYAAGRTAAADILADDWICPSMLQGFSDENLD
jgi:sialic acid synthase SpsE